MFNEKKPALKCTIINTEAASMTRTKTYYKIGERIIVSAVLTLVEWGKQGGTMRMFVTIDENEPETPEESRARGQATVAWFIDWLGADPRLSDVLDADETIETALRRLEGN
jgi:hypothetical protein